MDFAFVSRSPGLTLYCLALDAILVPASGAATFLLAERLTGLGAWSIAQITFLLGYATLVEGVLLIAFTYNVSHISRRIGQGVSSTTCWSNHSRSGSHCSRKGSHP
jgi:ABC-2 type transport system permease protein